MTTTRRQLHVTYVDGLERIVETDRDDAHGRRRIDALAFAYLSRPNVTAARSVAVQRVASTAGRGSYR